MQERSRERQAKKRQATFNRRPPRLPAGAVRTGIATRVTSIVLLPSRLFASRTSQVNYRYFSVTTRKLDLSKFSFYW